jgi:hypothetical protein
LISALPCSGRGQLIPGGILAVKKSEYIRMRKRGKYSNKRLELDGKAFIHCEFEDCLPILEKGETEISGCSIA